MQAEGAYVNVEVAPSGWAAWSVVPGRALAGASIFDVAPLAVMLAVAITHRAGAPAHFRETGHPFIQSFEPGEDWFYDFRSDESDRDRPGLAAEPS